MQQQPLSSTRQYTRWIPLTKFCKTLGLKQSRKDVIEAMIAGHRNKGLSCVFATDHTAFLLYGIPIAVFDYDKCTFEVVDDPSLFPRTPLEAWLQENGCFPVAPDVAVARKHRYKGHVYMRISETFNREVGHALLDLFGTTDVAFIKIAAYGDVMVRFWKLLNDAVAREQAHGRFVTIETTLPSAPPN